MSLCEPMRDQQSTLHHPAISTAVGRSSKRFHGASNCPHLLIARGARPFARKRRAILVYWTTVSRPSCKEIDVCFLKRTDDRETQQKDAAYKIMLDVSDCQTCFPISTQHFPNCPARLRWQHSRMPRSSLT